MYTEIDEDSVREVARVAYADMLHDCERNVKYAEAIVKTIKKLKKKNPGEELKCIDIGAGTGLLSMMAASDGKEISVKAYEAEPYVASASQKIIEENGFSDQIQVFNVRGEDARVNDRADILITELFDTELIGEGALHIYRSALKHIMKNPCMAVPSKARIYIQPIKSSFLASHNQLFEENLETEVCGRKLKLSVPQEFKFCPGSGILHDLQANQLKLDDDFCPLSDAQVVFEFDFSSIEGLPLKEEKFLHFQLNTKVDCDSLQTSDICLLFWWDLVMDSEETVILSTRPTFPKSGEEDLQTNWREHWIQAIYYIGHVFINECRRLDIIAKHDDFSFQFSVENAGQEKVKDYCVCGHHCHISRSRMKQLNNSLFLWTSLFSNITVAPKYFYFGDSSLLPLLCAYTNPSSQVVCVTQNDASIKFFHDFASVNNLSRLSVVDNCSSQEDYLESFVLIEPFLSSSDSTIDSIFRLWLDIPRTIVDEGILINRVVIKVVPVQFNHLWKTRASVSQVCGFNIRPFDDMIQSAIDSVDPDLESYPLWEYPSKCLSEPVVAFDVSRSCFLSKDNSFCHTFKVDPDLMNSSLKHIAFCWFIDLYNSSVLLYSTGLTNAASPGQYIEWKRDVRQLLSWSFFSGEEKVSLTETTVNAVLSSSSSPALNIKRKWWQ